MNDKKDLQKRVKILQWITIILFGILLIALIRVIFLHGNS